MNWFVLIAGVLYIFGAGQAVLTNNWRMVVVFLAYAVANFALMNAK